MDKISLADFWDMLNAHDWHHMMSDDGGVDRAGSANAARLARIAEQSEAHKELLKAFHQHNWSGLPWNTAQFPKPIRPCGSTE